jgi:RNA polymerase subunit RPABC4/transcription elongation factor Spt4
MKPSFGANSQPSSSHGANGGAPSSLIPGIVSCSHCHARFAEGVKFCGRCGGRSFVLISPGETTENSFVCPRCQIRLAAHSKFCGRCGLSIVASNVSPLRPTINYSQIAGADSLIGEKTCSRCGSVFAPGIKFCGRCGSAL